MGTNNGIIIGVSVAVGIGVLFGGWWMNRKPSDPYRGLPMTGLQNPNNRYDQHQSFDSRISSSDNNFYDAKSQQGGKNNKSKKSKYNKNKTKRRKCKNINN